MLVAPGFPDPTSLGSDTFVNFEIIMDVDTDPNRYPNASMLIKVFIINTLRLGELTIQNMIDFAKIWFDKN